MWIFLIFLFCLSSTRALHEDEKGLYDWHHSIIGRPFQVEFVRFDKKPNLIVATERQILSNLNVKTGNLVWRHVIPGLQHFQVLGNAVITFGTKLQRFELSSGFMSWESTQSLGKVSHTTLYGQKIALVSDGNTVKLLDAKNGAISYSHTFSQPVFHLRWVNDKLYALTAEKNRPQIVQIEKDSTEKQNVGVDLDPTEEPQVIVASKDWMLIKDKDDKIWTCKLTDCNPTMHAKAIPIGSRAHRWVNLPSQSTSNEVGIQCLDDTILLLKIDSNSGELKALSSFEQRVQPTQLATAALSTGNTFMAMVHVKPWKNISNVEVADFGKDSFKGPFVFPYHFNRHGYIDSVYLDVFKSEDEPSFRVLILSQDDTMNLYENDELLWTRNEALATTVDSLFVELPAENLLSQENDDLSESQKQTASSFAIGRYLHRWRLHLHRLFNRQTVAAIVQPGLVKDSFGLKKLVIFLSKGGKLTALETLTGTTVWSRFIGLDAKQVGAVDKSSTYHGLKLVLLRSTLIKFPPVLLVVGGMGGSTILQRIVAIDGTDFLPPVDHRQLDPLIVYPTEFVHVIRLPWEEEEERTQVVALVDKRNQIHLYPDLPSTRRKFEEFSHQFYFYHANIGSGHVEGYQALKERSTTGTFGSRQVYKVEFPPGELISGLGHRPSHEKVASQGRVLGNRSVLYKYLNPNVLAIATYRKDPSNVALYLMDTVKGTIHHHANHAGGVAPVHIVQAENWIVYTYWNKGGGDAVLAWETDHSGLPPEKRRQGIATKGQEVVVLEMYESDKPDQEMTVEAYSAFDHRKPFVAGQGYSFPTSISALGTTTTKSGISVRDVLFGLPTNQLLAINKRMLDPRRPTGPLTNDDKEEGLVPYIPVLALNPREVVSYTLDVLGIDTIITAPSDLESTSLVVAHGMDVFGTRVRPSKSFDVLSDDFNRVGLIATGVALVAGIVATRLMAQKKVLKDAWKTK